MAQQPPATACIVGLSLLIHIISYFGSGAVRLLALSPSRTITVNFYVWNVVTGSFLETNVIKAALAFPALFWAAGKLEKAWGAKALMQLLLMCAGLSGLVMLFWKVLLYILSGSSKSSGFFSNLYGCTGLILAAVVGLVRSNPELRVGLVHLRHIPLPLLVIYTFLGFSLPPSVLFFHDLGLAWVSFFVAFAFINWKHPSADGTAFALDVFFPDAVRPAMRAALILTIGFLHRFGLSGSSQRSSVYGPILPITSGSLKANASPTPRVAATLDPVAERRRARALRALDEKLAQISREPAVKLGSLAAPSSPASGGSSGSAANA